MVCPIMNHDGVCRRGKMSTEWIPKAIKQKNPKLTMDIMCSVPWVLDPDKLDEKLATRRFVITDIKMEDSIVFVQTKGQHGPK